MRDTIVFPNTSAPIVTQPIHTHPLRTPTQHENNAQSSNSSPPNESHSPGKSEKRTFCGNCKIVLKHQISLVRDPSDKMGHADTNEQLATIAKRYHIALDPFLLNPKHGKGHVCISPLEKTDVSIFLRQKSGVEFVKKLVPILRQDWMAQYVAQIGVFDPATYQNAIKTLIEQLHINPSEIPVLPPPNQNYTTPNSNIPQQVYPTFLVQTYPPPSSQQILPISPIPQQISPTPQIPPTSPIPQQIPISPIPQQPKMPISQQPQIPISQQPQIPISQQPQIPQPRLPLCFDQIRQQIDTPQPLSMWDIPSSARRLMFSQQPTPQPVYTHQQQPAPPQMPIQILPMRSVKVAISPTAAPIILPVENFSALRLSFPEPFRLYFMHLDHKIEIFDDLSLETYWAYGGEDVIIVYQPARNARDTIPGNGGNSHFDGDHPFGDDNAPNSGGSRGSSTSSSSTFFDTIQPSFSDILMSNYSGDAFGKGYQPFLEANQALNQYQISFGERRTPNTNTAIREPDKASDTRKSPYASHPPNSASNPPKKPSNPPKETSGPPKEASDPPKEASDPPKEASDPPKEASDPPSDPPTEASDPPNESNQPRKEANYTPKNANTNPILEGHFARHDSFGKGETRTIELILRILALSQPKHLVNFANAQDFASNWPKKAIRRPGFRTSVISRMQATHKNPSRS